MIRTEYNAAYNVYEKNINPLDTNKIPTCVIVHDGRTHADDLMAAWIIRQINPDVKIIRTRDKDTIKNGLMDPYTVVADVGYGCFDHHQVNNDFYDGDEDEVLRQMAACGKVWEMWGKRVVEKWIQDKKITLNPDDTIDTIKEQFLKYVIRPIEIKDTTIGKEHVPSKYIARQDKITDPEQESIISYFVRSYGTFLEIDECFISVLNEIDKIIENYDTESDLYPIVAALTNVNDDLLSMAKRNYILIDTELIFDFIKHGGTVCDRDKKIVYLWMPFYDLDRIKNETNIRVFAECNRNQTEIIIHAIDPSIHFTSEKITKLISKQIFVHPNGHMCSIPLKQGNEKLTPEHYYDCIEAVMLIGNSYTNA